MHIDAILQWEEVVLSLLQLFVTHFISLFAHHSFSLLISLTFIVSHRENLIEQWLTNLAIYASIYYYITRNIAPFSFYTLLATFVHLCNRWTYLENSSSEIPFAVDSLYYCMHQYDEWLLLHYNASSYTSVVVSSFLVRKSITVTDHRFPLSNLCMNVAMERTRFEDVKLNNSIVYIVYTLNSEQ